MGSINDNEFDVNSMNTKAFSKDVQIVEINSKQVQIETQDIKPPAKQKE